MMDYRQDDTGQWWFYGKRQRNRCKTYRCMVCGIEFPRLWTLVIDPVHIFCSRKCSNERTAEILHTTRRGANNPSWKGGRKRDSGGYIRVYQPEHPNSDQKGCVSEHRLVMEKRIKRLLLKEETVHHINGIKDDNHIRNLELWTSSHPAGQKVEDVLKWARSIIALYGAEWRGTK